jgi:hypothetical protein
VFDRDSSDFTDDEEEEQYNDMLLALEKAAVWQIDRKHEDAVRSAVGEKKYQVLTQRYPGFTNATRQRLIAADPDMPVPVEFVEALQWLVPDRSQGVAP